MLGGTGVNMGCAAAGAVIGITGSAALTELMSPAIKNIKVGNSEYRLNIV